MRRAVELIEELKSSRQKHLAGMHNQRTHAPKSYSKGLNSTQQDLMDSAKRNAWREMTALEDRWYDTSESKKLGMSRKEYDDAVDVMEQDLRESGHLVIGTSLEGAVAIGKSGVILGQDEIPRSKVGTVANPAAQKKRDTFDLAVKGNNIAYATYSVGLSPYGTVGMVVDNNLLDNATATFGDTMDQVVSYPDLTSGNVEGVKESLRNHVMPATQAPRLLAGSLANRLYPQDLREIITSGKITDRIRNNIAIGDEPKTPYIEVQVLVPKGGIDKSAITAMTYKTPYPGSKFQFVTPLKGELRAEFPNIPIKEGSYPWDLAIRYEEMPDLVVE